MAGPLEPFLYLILYLMRSGPRSSQSLKRSVPGPGQLKPTKKRKQQWQSNKARGKKSRQKIWLPGNTLLARTEAEPRSNHGHLRNFVAQ